ncbi:MAG: glycoside hydrolase family 127 protein [Paludibacter sp.]|nr:glycoside hydrolase family 127 protein [Paludibacter sp.]
MNKMKPHFQYKYYIILFLSVFTLLSFAENKIPVPQAIPFPLSSVRLTDSRFKRAMEADEKWLLSFNPDRFLSGFRTESGLKPKAPKYGGWESQGVAGQTFGHYLSALSMMYASTGNELLNDRIKYSVNELDSCQQAFDYYGLVEGFPRARDLFTEIARGDIQTAGFDLNGCWVPLYNLHKLFAGLIDVYNYTGNRQAYDVLLKLANGFEHIMSGLPDSLIQKILLCEHGGINESMAEVYALTGNKKFIVLAERLNHKVILDPLAREQDDLAGKHANTQIPKVIGVMREYELTGNEKFFKTADFFWNTVVHNHSYVIGGNSESEHFGIPGRTCDRITDKTCETCNTYNMLKLTKHLFMLHPSGAKADYYERALYNQILGSQNPETGMVCYMSPLSTNSRRQYSTPFDSFWCCVGTGLENHARYGEFIYCTDQQNDLYVNLFIPSVLNWESRSVKVVQETAFPASDTIRIRLEMKKRQKFTLKLRYPEWAKNGFSLYVNGKPVRSKITAENYVAVKRRWSDGDRISWVVPESVTSEAALGDEHIRAYLYGPVVLSGVLDGKHPVYPVVVTDSIGDAASVVERAGRTGLNFQMKKSQPYQIGMKPYYERKDSELMVYFEHYTTGEWKKKKDEILLKQNYDKWVKAQMVSEFQPGEMQPERDHNFTGKNLGVGEMQGRKYRKAVDGGWFSFEMPVLPDQPLDLSATFWGNLGDIYKFNIEVEDVSIATVIIHWWGNSFIEKNYHIPESLTKGKNKVAVTFRALDDKSVAGPLFSCEILKR